MLGESKLVRGIPMSLLIPFRPVPPIQRSQHSAYRMWQKRYCSSSSIRQANRMQRCKGFREWRGVRCWAASVPKGVTRRCALCHAVFAIWQTGSARASIPLKLASSPGGSATKSSSQASPSLEGAERVIDLLARARAYAADGNTEDAFSTYDEVVRQYGDYALAEYARLGRSLMRYELGDAKRAIVELEYEVINNTGFAEAHAALSAASWSSGKSELAEDQWELAMEFEPRFADVSWVKRSKSWGPKLLEALELFLQLKAV